MTEPSSEPTAEGLTEAERAALAHVVWPPHFDDPLLDEVVDVVELILADRLAAAQAERDEDVDGRILRLANRYKARAEFAEADAANLQHDLDRCEERLWRLAGLTGYVPTESDNNATAEQVVVDALADAAAARAKVERVEADGDECVQLNGRIRRDRDDWRQVAIERRAQLKAVTRLLQESCHHCGRTPEEDGDHTCLCPSSDSECLTHTVDPVVSRSALHAALGGDQ